MRIASAFIVDLRVVDLLHSTIHSVCNATYPDPALTSFSVHSWPALDPGDYGQGMYRYPQPELRLVG
jgi:hypothetical protein